MMSNSTNVLLNRSFSARFHEAVSGTFSPGYPIGLIGVDEGKLRWVYQHECAHSVLTHGSTLGAAAILCGMVDLYSDDGERRQKVRKYLTKYANKCCRAHEGTATAIAISMIPTFGTLGIPYAQISELEKSLPRTYMLLATQIFDFVVQVVELARLDDPNDISFLLTSLTIAFGLVVMSPSVDDDFFRSALRGDDVTPKPLKSVENRLRHCLAHYPVLTLAECAVDWSKDETRRTVSEQIHAKFHFARAMATSVDLEFCEVQTIAPYFLEYLPELIDHAEFVKPAALTPDHQKVFFEVQHSSLFRPQRVKYLLDPNPTAFMQSTHHSNHFCIAEAGWSSAGRMLVLHAFCADGKHLSSHVSPTELFDQSLLQYTKLFPTSLDERIGSGIVVSLEALQDNLELFKSLQHCDLVRVSLHQRSFSKVESRLLLWGEHGIGVYFIRRVDHIEWYEVAPLSFRQAAVPSPRQRALTWILQNGLTASIRWSKQRIEDARNV